MKKLLSASAFVLLVAQLLMLPAMVSAIPDGLDDGFSFGRAVHTEPATDVSASSAVLNGNIRVPAWVYSNEGIQFVDTPVKMRFHFKVYFQYGNAPGDYPMSTPIMDVSSSDPTIRFDQLVEGLTSCAVYYYRAVGMFTEPAAGDFEPAGSLFALSNAVPACGTGLGMGVNGVPLRHAQYLPPTIKGFGEEMSFKTLGCRDISHGAWLPELAKGPVKMSNIVVKTAAVSSARVAPGEKVDVTASLTNSGASNGTTKVTLYVNGQQAEVKGVTLTGGESQAIHFTTSQSEPGTYQVFVNGTSAGAFTVDLFRNNDILIYGVIAVFTIGIAGVLYAVTRRRSTA